MTRAPHPGLARAGAAVAAAMVILCGGVLVADYAVARARLPRDGMRVAELQAQARVDASAARALEAEQDRITRARLARRARIDALAIVLIAASAAFVGCVKWRIAQGPSRPAVAPLAVRVPFHAASPLPPGQRAPDAAGAALTSPPIDLSFVDRIVEREGTSQEAAIPILQAIQAHYRYLPDEALKRVCELTAVTPAQIAGTSSFYARFRRSPVGEHVVRVCHGTACHVSGARQITDELRRQLGIPPGADTDARGQFTIDEVACLGCCSLAPVLMVDEHAAGRLTPDTACAALHAAVARS